MIKRPKIPEIVKKCWKGSAELLDIPLHEAKGFQHWCDPDRPHIKICKQYIERKELSDFEKSSKHEITDKKLNNELKLNGE